MKKEFFTKYWMTNKPCIISPDCSVKKAFIMMKRKNFRHLLISKDNPENQLLGIVSDRDLRRPDAPENDGEGLDYFYRLDDSYQVSHIMTTDVKTVYEDDYIGKPIQLFRRHHFGAIPVLDKNDKIAGIISIYDILDALTEQFSILGTVIGDS